MFSVSYDKVKTKSSQVKETNYCWDIGLINHYFNNLVVLILPAITSFVKHSFLAVESHLEGEFKMAPPDFSFCI